MVHVLQIQADGARRDQAAGSGFGDVTVAGFQIGRHWQRHGGACSLRRFPEHQVLRDALAIGIAERECDSRAGGRDRGKASQMKNARAQRNPMRSAAPEFPGRGEANETTPPCRFAFFIGT